jgi:hypothetical protein
MFVKCSCTRCKNHIEFDSQFCGDVIECPHCHEQTRLPFESQLKPVGDERTWCAADGRITHLKCPKCRRMVLVTHESRDGREYVRFTDHQLNAGWSCDASQTCYRVAE